MTSKKCWAIGMKLSTGAAGASSGGLGITPDSKRSFASAVGAEKSDLEMVPTAAELTLNTLYASQLQQRQAVAAAFLHYDPSVTAAAATQTQQYLAQLAGGSAHHGFLPFSTAAHLGKFSQIVFSNYICIIHVDNDIG